jgi:hypothetical protein
MPDFDSLSREELISLAEKAWAVNELLLARVAALEEELARLRKDPPSGVAPAVPAFVKENTAPKEVKPRKKRSHSHVRRREKSTSFRDHVVEQCPDCGRKLGGGWVHRSRQVIEIPVGAYEVIEHRMFRHHCGVCGKNHVARPDLSSEVVGRHRVGIRLMSLVVQLKKSGRMTVSGIQKVLKSLYGLHLGRGEIIHILHAVARMGQPSYEALQEQVRGSPGVHVDETSWRKNGKNEWMWAFCTPSVRLFVQDASRGHQVPERVLGEQYQGVIASDFYVGYNYHLGLHQRCWVHYLRDLRELVLKHPKDKRLVGWVARVKKVWEQAKAFQSENPKKRIRARERFQERLRAIAEPVLGTDTPQRVLAERIRKHAHELFTFVEHTCVDPDNNVAERAIRPVVIYRKVTGGSRSDKGSATTSVLLSLVGTWALRGHDPFGECTRMLAGISSATNLSHEL